MEEDHGVTSTDKMGRPMANERSRHHARKQSGNEVPTAGNDEKLMAQVTKT